MAVTLADMDLFSIVEGGKCILSDKGIYRQCDMYEQGGFLFAGYRAGFVRLLARNLTTVPTIRWQAIEGIAYREEYNGPKRSAAAASMMAAE